MHRIVVVVISFLFVKKAMIEIKYRFNHLFVRVFSCIDSWKHVFEKNTFRGQKSPPVILFFAFVNKLRSGDREWAGYFWKFNFSNDW